MTLASRIAEIALQKKQRKIRYWVVVALDLNNAFNSVGWDAIERVIHYLRILPQVVLDSLCRILEREQLQKQGAPQ